MIPKGEQIIPTMHVDSYTLMGDPSLAALDPSPESLSWNLLETSARQWCCMEMTNVQWSQGVGVVRIVSFQMVLKP